jgi:oxamate amidohydrolase
LAALTVAGTVGGWIRASELARQWGGRMPLALLLQHAIRHAKDGTAVTESQAQLTSDKLAELVEAPGFATIFLTAGHAPAKGVRQRFPELAETLEQLSHAGLEDFYRGDVARALARDLEAAGSPLRLHDLEAYQAQWVTPLAVSLATARAFNLPPPTQGIASLMILAVLDRLGPPSSDTAAFIHDVVEATKQAFLVRDAEIFDPAFMRRTPADLLAEENGPYGCRCRR